MPVGLPSGWETDVLIGVAAPPTQGNIGFLDAWQQREGGSTANDCNWNPLNTTLFVPGSADCNSVHVQSYTNWGMGDYATAATLRGYPHIVAMLRSGNPDPGWPGVGDEMRKWSGGAYSWPGSSSSGGGSSGDGGGSTGGGAQDPNVAVCKQVAEDILNGKISLADAKKQHPECDLSTGGYPGQGVVHAIGSAGDALRFLFSFRGLEVIAGLALVLVGIAGLSRAVGGPSVNLPGPVG